MITQATSLQNYPSPAFPWPYGRCMLFKFSNQMLLESVHICFLNTSCRDIFLGRIFGLSCLSFVLLSPLGFLPFLLCVLTDLCYTL